MADYLLCHFFLFCPCYVCCPTSDCILDGNVMMSLTPLNGIRLFYVSLFWLSFLDAFMFLCHLIWTGLEADSPVTKSQSFHTAFKPEFCHFLLVTTPNTEIKQSTSLQLKNFCFHSVICQ